MAQVHFKPPPPSESFLIQCVPELDFRRTRSGSASASGASTTLPTPTDEHEPLLGSWGAVKTPAKSFASSQATGKAHCIWSARPQYHQDLHGWASNRVVDSSQHLSLPSSQHTPDMSTPLLRFHPQHIATLHEDSRAYREDIFSGLFRTEVSPEVIAGRSAFSCAFTGGSLPNDRSPMSRQALQRHEVRSSLPGVGQGSTQRHSIMGTIDTPQIKTHKRQNPSLKLSLEARGIQPPVLQFQHKRLLALRVEVRDAGADVRSGLARSEVVPSLLPPSAMSFIAYIGSKSTPRDPVCSSFPTAAPPKSAFYNHNLKYVFALERAATIKQRNAAAEQSSLALMTLVLGVLVIWVAAMGVCCGLKLI